MLKWAVIWEFKPLVQLSFENFADVADALVEYLKTQHCIHFCIVNVGVSWLLRRKKNTTVVDALVEFFKSQQSTIISVRSMKLYMSVSYWFLLPTGVKGGYSVRTVQKWLKWWLFRRIVKWRRRGRIISQMSTTIVLTFSF